MNEVLYETVVVTLENIPAVALRSGRSEEDLSKMFLVRAMQNKTLEVRYELKLEYYDEPLHVTIEKLEQKNA